MSEKLTKSFWEMKSIDEPYVIAEIGVNHGGDVAVAKRQIQAALKGGASAVKFQSYKASSLASRNSPSYWDLSEEPTRSQFELFSKYDTFEVKDYIELANFCMDLGIDFSTTPFSASFVEPLKDFVTFFKIASADITNIPLLRTIGAAGKPIALSTGASEIWEIALAIDELHSQGVEELSLLHCILSYPTKNEDANLSMITSLAKTFPYIIGYSDHTKADESLTSLQIAVTLGAKVIEKHFTDTPDQTGNDHYHAMTSQQLRNFRNWDGKRRVLIGDSNLKRPIKEESGALLNARRGIYSSQKIRAGDIFSEENLTTKRPVGKVGSQYWDSFIGKTSSRDIGEDESVGFEEVGFDL